MVFWKQNSMSICRRHHWTLCRDPKVEKHRWKSGWDRRTIFFSISFVYISARRRHCAVRRSSRCALESRSDCFRASDNTGYPVPICAPMLCRNWFSATTASSAYSSDKLFTYLARETRIGGVTHVMGGARLRVWRSVRLLRRVFPSNSLSVVA